MESTEYLIKSDIIQNFIENDPNLNYLYLNGCSNKKLGEDYFETILKLTNLIFSRAKKEAELGKLQGKIVTNYTGPSTTSVICQIFENHLKIKVDHSAPHVPWNLSWEADNPYLNPKPVIQREFIEKVAREAHFSHMLESVLFKFPCFTDVTFTIKNNNNEDEIIMAHKFMLAQAPYFANMFNGPWKESQGNIEFNDYSYECFTMMLTYLYKGEVPSSYFDKPDQLIELLKLADYIGLKGLREMCLEEIYKRINPSNFLEIALAQIELDDSQIKRLCQWFIKANPHFGEDLDLRCLPLFQLVAAFEVGTFYNAEHLITCTMNQIQSSLKLDEDFISLCNRIEKMKNNRLKSCLVDLMKKNPSLLKQLKEGKKDQFKEHWEAYTEIMADVTI